MNQSQSQWIYPHSFEHQQFNHIIRINDFYEDLSGRYILKPTTIHFNSSSNKHFGVDETNRFLGEGVKKERNRVKRDYKKSKKIKIKKKFKKQKGKTRKVVSGRIKLHEHRKKKIGKKKKLTGHLKKKINSLMKEN